VSLGLCGKSLGGAAKNYIKLSKEHVPANADHGNTFAIIKRISKTKTKKLWNLKMKMPPVNVIASFVHVRLYVPAARLPLTKSYGRGSSPLPLSLT